jgi:hypothetical protein
MMTGSLKTFAATAFVLCGAALPARPQADVLPDFGTVSEGFTSPNRTTGIDAAYRMFSGSNFDKACEGSKVPFRLVSPNRLVTLRVGEWFPLSRFVVVGEDRSGDVLPSLPIMIEVERKEPPLLNLRTDMISTGRGLLSIQTGRFRFRARTICEGTSAKVFIEAVVRSK